MMEGKSKLDKTRFMYLKIAGSNLKNNRRAYLPYILSSIAIIMNFYIVYSIAQNEGINEMIGGAYVKVMMLLGTIIIGIFAVIFLIYTNSFLMKQRKKEIGLYCILGMEKKHIGKVLFYETIMTSICSLGLGIILGMIFSKLMFLLLLFILQSNVTLGFYISYQGILVTFTLFGSIFLITLLSNLFQIRVSNPINLLHGGEKGEREPKSKILITLFGIVTLGAGYFIALTVESPIAAVYMFFIAAALVIFGVYALFTSGSISVLKILKRNKSFYYTPKNFITVSSMIYRMKANAVGLSNICILSTMVLVILSITVSLYAGSENVRNNMFPVDCRVHAYDASFEVENGIDDLINKVAVDHNVTAVDKLNYRYIEFKTYRDKDELLTKEEEGRTSLNNSYDLIVTPISEFNRVENSNLELSKSEIFIFTTDEDFENEVCKIGDLNFKIKSALEKFYIETKEGNYNTDIIGIVVSDENVMQEIQNEFDSEHEMQTNYTVAFNLRGNEENIESFNIALEKEALAKGGYLRSKVLEGREIKGMYGSFLFIGIFLGVLFIIATVLIIYYKQISEGYDDNQRFKILQKVGMSKSEVKKTIQKQILMVFFIPLVGAIINLCVAFNLITKFLGALRLTDIPLFVICTAVIVVLFTIFYIFVFNKTAKTYYKIVN